MKRIQVSFSSEELTKLREAAVRSGRSVADLVREAVRSFVFKQRTRGPVAIWDGKPKRPSVQHDSICDEM